MDRFFSESPPLIAILDKDAVRSKRPAKYIDIEEAEYRRNSSVVSASARQATDNVFGGSKEGESPTMEEDVGVGGEYHRKGF